MQSAFLGQEEHAWPTNPNRSLPHNRSSVGPPVLLCPLRVTTTGKRPTTLGGAVHCRQEELNRMGCWHGAPPTNTVGSGLVGTPFRPKLAPHTNTRHAASALHGDGLTAVMMGGSYKNGTELEPLPGLVTTREMFPRPGPGGARHRSSANDTDSTSHGRSPMDTLPLATKFCSRRSRIGESVGGQVVVVGRRW